MMRREVFVIGKGDLEGLVRGIAKVVKVVAPIERGGSVGYEVIDELNLRLMRLDGPRPIASFKPFLLPQSQVLLKFAARGKPFKLAPLRVERVLLLGLRACDLKAIEILDRIFGKGFADPYYHRRRGRLLLASVACESFSNYCFCTSLNLRPRPERGYDLNLLELNSDMLIEVGSTKGLELLRRLEVSLPIASEQELKEGEEAGLKIFDRAFKAQRRLNMERLKEDIYGPFNEAMWRELSRRCLECLGCTFICPLCHCFQIYDRPGERVIGWDSCILESFARTANGVNIRKNLFERIRHRVYCKFVCFPAEWGDVGCVGCGRCIETCLGRIDFRDVVEELMKEKLGRA